PSAVGDPRSLELFLVPTPRLGTVADVMPERITAGMNEWITLSKQVLAHRREWAAKGHPSPPNTDVTEDHDVVRPFGAQFCPALQEVNLLGWLLKWPANAVLKRTGSRWQIHAAGDFYKIHTMASFPEAGDS